MRALMYLLFVVMLICGTLAQDKPMSEAEYLASKSKTRNAVGPKPSVPPHLRSMFDDLSVEIKPVMHGVQKTRKASAPTKSYIPPWMYEADSLPKPVDLTSTPITLKAGESEVTPAWILGADDRRYFSSRVYPFSTVAKITGSTGGRCSGSLIGPRHVLTASHCINWSGIFPITVEINKQGSYVAGTSRVTNVVYWKQVNPWTTLNIDDDYVVLILNTRLGDSFGWLGTIPYNTAWDFQNVFNTLGYASDLSNMDYPIYQFGFSLDEADFDGTRANLAIKSQMDLIKGQSGSPTYTLLNGDRRVVGVASGYTNSPFANWIGGGQDMVDLVVYARNTWP